MNFLRRLAIALHRLLFGSPARSRSNIQRSRLYDRQFIPRETYGYENENENEYQEYADFDSRGDFNGWNEWDSWDDWNAQLPAHDNYLIAQPYSAQAHYYSSPYPSNYYPQMLQWQGIDRKSVV